jgi:hypothetical protein
MYQANLEMPPGAAAPDAYDESCGRVPADTFIVSKDRYGKPKSVFSELMWDFSAYNPDGKVEKLYFAFWGSGRPTEAQLRLSGEARYIVFCLIWRRTGSPLSTGTLRNYLSVLSRLADYADGSSTSIASVLGSHSQLEDFVVTRCSGWMAETLGSLLPQLARLGPVALGFDVVGDKRIKTIKARSAEYRARIRQHPPIPTRLYSLFISSLLRELDEWLAVADNLLDAARLCGANPCMGRRLDTQIKICKRENLPHTPFPTLEELLDERSIAFLSAREKSIDLLALSSAIGQAQYIAKLIIQTFSGMRDDEVNTLPYHCATLSDTRGTLHYLVQGRTTKFANGLAHRTRWVTNKEGHRAIQAAQAIADVIYGIHKVVTAESPERLNDHPLFVSVLYLKFTGASAGLVIERHFRPGLMAHRELPGHCSLIIQEEDLRELEHIDPHRAWRSEEKFQAGAQWTFTSHQTRRSLALYAQRSGLVSLPSLRRQLKHITDDMSRYYARGSAFAKNFIGENRDHFGNEWQAAQAESSALSYILNVLMADEPQFGAHAHWVQQRLRKPEGIVHLDRAATMKRFRNGEQAYKETILGGCTSLGPCDKVALRWLHTACVAGNCRNLAGRVSRLDLVIEAQRNLIARLDGDCVEYRTETRDLETLMKAREAAMERDGRRT